MNYKLITAVLLAFCVSNLTLAQDLNYQGEQVVKTQDNISQIFAKPGGQLVKTGQINKYLTDYKKFNVSLNPLGLITGTYSLTGAIALHSSIVAQLDIGYYNPVVGFEASGLSFGASALFYLKKTFDGIFFDIGLDMSFLEKDGESSKVFGPFVSVGHTWIWDSGFNLGLSGGLQRNFLNKDTGSAVFDAFDKIRPRFSFRLGYAFN